MQRRDFLKISAISGATAALDGCGQPEIQLIRFVPEEELTPGIAVWKPGLCTLCPAGCGLMVRVMEGDAEVIRHGKLGLIKMGLAKKLEGNPHHPINQGKLCPRGQAGLQLTYHPDRVRNPLKRTGPRGSGQFEEITWNDAIKELLSQLAALHSGNQTSSLAFLSRPLRGQRSTLVARFLETFGAPPAITFELFDQTILRRANALSFGVAQLPTFDLARANYVVSFGADYLGTWNSPVAQNIAYGEMRRGRPGLRAKFVQIEPRMSQTGANADEWVPARPGTEGILALGLAHVMMKEQLRAPADARRAGGYIQGWFDGLSDYSPYEVEKKTGVRADRVTRLAREMATHSPAVAMIGGAPLAQTNSMFNALAVNALNALLGSVERPGGIFFTPRPFSSTEKSAASPPHGSHSAFRAFVEQIVLSRPFGPTVVLLYDTNPVFSTPPEWRARDAFAKVPFLASFGSFVDDTSIYADLILPDHSPLESWMDDVPESGTMQATLSLAPPAVRPIHNTRAMPDVLLDVAHQLGADLSSALPWKSYEEMLKTTVDQLHQRGSSGPSEAEDFWKKVQQQGGWWGAGTETSIAKSEGARGTPYTQTEPQFAGNDKDFPFHFLPYASQQFYDGSLAHLPWMQEVPDPLSSVMWGSWLEMNPETAQKLGLQQGDLVEVVSVQGKLQAPVFISPGIAPEVVAMPVGQGHLNFTRYASQRGANPVSILASQIDPETESLAWAATRVKVTRVGKGKLILFSGAMRELPHEHERR
jgi:anaerobic selenocysteine-containing dehydrogenase